MNSSTAVSTVPSQACSGTLAPAGVELPWIEDAVKVAPKDARKQLRFGEEMTQAEIGKRLGCSQMHVSRLLNRTLAHLRTHLLAPA